MSGQISPFLGDIQTAVSYTHLDVYKRQLQRLAREAGGTALFLAHGAFGAALRLPRADGLPLRRSSRAEELLADRYALPRLYLDGFCAEPEL